MKWNVFFFCILHIFQNVPCTLGEKSKCVSFSRVYVCVKAKLTLVSFFFNFFFYAPFPNPNDKNYAPHGARIQLPTQILKILPRSAQGNKRIANPWHRTSFLHLPPWVHLSPTGLSSLFDLIMICVLLGHSLSIKTLKSTKFTSSVNDKSNPYSSGKDCSATGGWTGWCSISFLQNQL